MFFEKICTNAAALMSEFATLLQHQRLRGQEAAPNSRTFFSMYGGGIQ